MIREVSNQVMVDRSLEYNLFQRATNLQHRDLQRNGITLSNIHFLHRI
jgi:hypothetical protein